MTVQRERALIVNGPTSGERGGGKLAAGEVKGGREGVRRITLIVDVNVKRDPIRRRMVGQPSAEPNRSWCWSSTCAGPVVGYPFGTVELMNGSL